MALFQIALKSDKKRRNGVKETVKAIEHIEYINREGKYKDYDDKEKLNNIENVISVDGDYNLLHGVPSLLYKSPYGCISNTPHGIAVTHKPSLDTLAIALTLAHESLGDGPLKVNGSNLFKKRCITAAATAGLNISFADADMQKKFTDELEREEHERRKFIEAGGKIVPYQLPQSNTNRSFQNIAQSPAIGTLSAMHNMPQRSMVSNGSENAAMLVQSTEHSELGYGEPKPNASLRWDISRGRRIRAERTAKQILKTVELNQDNIYAESHIEYINREKAFTKKGGCIYKEHKLPKWANDSPNEFFKAADRYTSKDDCRYYEIEFALPNEFSLGQNLELIHRFINENLPNNYYNFAIHDKIAALSDGDTHNTHVHITFSPRLIDDIEKTNERTKSHYFKYPLRKNTKDQSAENRRNHGAPCDRKWSKKSTVPIIRESYARIQNELLEKYGFAERVDHRSLKEQRQIALMNGDTYLAALLDRIPESHIPQKYLLEEKNPLVENVKEYRKYMEKYQDTLYKYHMLQQKEREASELDKSNLVKKQLLEITKSIEYNSLDDDAPPMLRELKDNFLSALVVYEDVVASIKTEDAAERQARIGYMYENEREIYTQYEQKMQEIDGLKETLSKVKTVQDENTEFKDSQNDLISYLDKMIALGNNELFLLKLKVDEINARLDNPSIKKRIQNYTRNIIFKNKRLYTDLNKKRQNLQIAAFSLQQALFDERNRENNMPEYNERELYNIIKRRYFGYKKERDKVANQAQIARKSVISIERARMIAEDKVLGGRMKEHRKNLNNFNKARRNLVENFIKPYREAKFRLKKLPQGEEKTAMEITVRELQDKYLAKKSEIRNFRAEINSAEKNLIQELAKPNIQKKISDVTIGVIHKNAPALNKYRKIFARQRELTGKVDKLYKQMLALQKAIKGKTHFRYKVNKNALPHHEPPEIAAGAIAGDEHFAQVTARTNEKDDTKNWALMSNLAKEEELAKQMYNEI